MRKNPLLRLFGHAGATQTDNTNPKPLVRKIYPAVISNGFMAAMFLSCWIWPNWLSSGQVQYLSLLTLVEIIMVMLMFFLVPLLIIDLDRKMQYFIVGFILLFFGSFIVVMALGIDEPMAIAFFVYAIVIKIISIQSLRQGTTFGWALGIEWVGTTVILFVALIIAFALPLPELGMTQDGSVYFDKPGEAKYNMEIEFSAYEKEPQTAMAFGIAFYTLQSLLQGLKSKLAQRKGIH